MLNLQLAFILILLVACSVVIGMIVSFLIFRPSPAAQAVRGGGSLKSRSGEEGSRIEDFGLKLEALKASAESIEKSSPAPKPANVPQKIIDTVAEPPKEATHPREVPKPEPPKSEAPPEGSPAPAQSQEDADEVLKLLQKKPFSEESKEEPSK